MYINLHQLHFADDWRCDGYRWYQNGIKNIILKIPTGTSNNFKRHDFCTHSIPW